MAPATDLPTTDKTMTFHLRGNGGNYVGAEWIAAEGIIVPETPSHLENFIKSLGYSENPGGWAVRFNSPGGDLAGGVRLGELIRKLKLDTEVGATEPDAYGHWQRTAGYCASASAFAFLGGLSRDVSGGELGVHQFYNAISIANPSAKIFDSLDVSHHQFISALLIEYAFRMGVDPRFVSAASSTPPDQMNFLDERALDDMNIRWRPKALGPWSIEPKGGGVVAVARSKDKTLTVTFACFSDGVPRLTFSRKLRELDWDWLKNAVSAVQNVTAFDLTFPKEALELRVIDSCGALEFSLPGVTGTTVVESKWPGLGVTGPRFIESAFSFEVPKENAEISFGIAMRNNL